MKWYCLDLRCRGAGCFPMGVYRADHTNDRDEAMKILASVFGKIILLILRQVIAVVTIVIFMAVILLGGLQLIQGPSWLKGRAEQGDPGAQYRLGRAYMQKTNGKNINKGLGWYNLAARNGSAAAMTAIGRAYEEGLGGPQDYVHALAWYRRAAAAGSPGAHLRIAQMYARGRGIPRDRRAAWAWRLTAVRAVYRQIVTNTVTTCRTALRKIRARIADVHETLLLVGTQMAHMRSALSAIAP